MLGNDDEKKEIVVKAPSQPVISSQKKIEKATAKELEEERYNVITIHRKLDKYFGLFSACMGGILLLVLTFTMLTDQSNLMFLTVNMPISIVGIWVAIGLVSIVAGFLLIGSE